MGLSRCMTDDDFLAQARYAADASRQYDRDEAVNVAREYGMELVPLLTPDYLESVALIWHPDGPEGPEVLLMRMALNWRIIEPDGYLYGRSWCIRGYSHYSIRLAVLAMLGWRGNPDTEPIGYLNGHGSEHKQTVYQMTVLKMLERIPEPPAIDLRHHMMMDHILVESWNTVRDPWDPA